MGGETKEDILLICYSFPPYPGIGGRRWAKFSKYLTRKGYRFHVIGAEPPSGSSSNWIEDVADDPDIIRHSLPRAYPAVLNKVPEGLLEKLQYRVHVQRLKWTTKGDHYDRAVFWRKNLLNKAKELIREHDIWKVISSGAPYHLCYHATFLKEEFPNIKLITDLRDPWTIRNEEWSFGNLSKKKQAQEKSMEKTVIQRSNKVLSVYPEMTAHYKEAFPELEEKFSTLPNGYDEEDIIQDEVQKEGTGGQALRIVFAGSLYGKLDHILIPFLKGLSELKSQEKRKYDRFRFEFFGSQEPHIRALKDELQLERVTFHGTVPLKEAMKEISRSDMCMLFLLRNYEFTLSTKFYEYVAHNKKIVLFSEKGKVAEFLEKEGLGHHISPSDIKGGLRSLLEKVDEGFLEVPNRFDLSKVNVRYLTDELARTLGS